MEKIYIAGAGGMLGSGFNTVFNDKYKLYCTDIDVNENWLNYLDFRDLDSYRNDVKSFKPNYLFHLGAHTSLEYCEENPEDAYQTNTLSVENASYIANELDIPLLYISTAGIFDGKQNTYDDWDTPNPLGVYARSKYMGELFVQRNVRKHLICRAGWMMGGGAKKDKKFVNKIIKQIKDGSKELFIVDDKLGTPTYTIDFAKNVEILLRKEYWGLYNMVCKGNTSRYEVAEEILHILNLNEDVKVNSVTSKYFEKEYFAPRPESERLLTKKLDYRNINIMRPWKDALYEYVNDSYNDMIIKQ